MIATDTLEKLELGIRRKKMNVDKRKLEKVRGHVLKDDEETDCDESQLQLQVPSEDETFICSYPVPENICNF